VLAPEYRQVERKSRRLVMRDLKRDRVRLFKALEDLVNTRPNKQGWSQFRRYWPDFFLGPDYDGIFEGSEPNILNYPTWLDGLWEGPQPDPILSILLGVEQPPKPDECESHEDAYGWDIAWIPAHSYLDWSDGAFCYVGSCDFQRALYLLFRESWRARVCNQCKRKFIARRAAQKYCSTDCSEGVQQELKLKWWAQNGQKWRKARKASSAKKKGCLDGSRKTR
jgi:hypothetical protein